MHLMEMEEFDNMKISRLLWSLIKSIITILIISALAFFLAGATIMWERNAEAETSKQTLQDKYSYHISSNFYFDNEEIQDDASETIINTYKILPSHISSIIKNNWNIVVASQQPFPSTNIISAAGITYSSNKTIWLKNGFDESVFIHEIGHAVDAYLGDISYKGIFRELYYSNWEAYREYDKDKVDKHSTSSTNEFFAAMFVEYFLYPDNLKEQSLDMYDYFHGLLKNNWRFSEEGELINAWYNTGYVVYDFAVQIFEPRRPHSNVKSVVKINNQNIADNNDLVLDQYTRYFDIEWMSNDTKTVAEAILAISNNPDSYPNEQHGFSKGYLIEFNYPWSVDMYTEILSFTSAYFGDEELDPLDVNVINKTRTEVVIKHDIVAIGEKNRIDSLKNVENVLSTLKSGTNTELAIQVGAYIYNNSSYKSEKYSSFNSFWENKKGDCVMYAIVFKQFMDRLGIQNDIIHVVSDQGEGHVYNRIFDGTSYRYYDIAEGIFNKDVIDKAGYHINTWQVS